MEANQPKTAEFEASATEQEKASVTVTINKKPVTLRSHRVTGIEIKRAAIAQGLAIEEDFLLTLEAHDGEPAKTIGDEVTITVTKNSVFTANDGDDDS